MQQELFESRHNDEWTAFEDWLKVDAGATPRGDKDYFPVYELPHRYRQLARHLALARDRQYGSQLVSRLESMVLAGHQAIYSASHNGESGVYQFIRQTFPALVRKHWQSVLVASICLFGPMILLTIIIQFFPDFAYVMISPEQLARIQQMYDPSNATLGEARGAGSDVAMWGFYVWNNVRIDFQCFAGGLFFGVGAIFFMIFNGVHIGVIAGHLTHLGYIETFWGFVAGHSALELVGAALSGAAGLQIGYALVAPGRMTRLEALKVSVPDAVRILIGAATMTFMAAFIEAFWSASRVPPVNIKYAVGIGLWIVVLLYFFYVGRGKSTQTLGKQNNAS